MIFFFLFSQLALGAELDGLWRQDCRRGYQKEEMISGSFAEFTERNFRDVLCTQPALALISRGQLITGATVAQPRSAHELDFVFSTVSVMPLDQAAAAFYEDIQLCGLRGWRIGQEKEITGMICSFFGGNSFFVVPAKGTRKFGIVKKGEGEIFFGRLSPDRDGSSPLKRPIALEESAFRRIVIDSLQ